MSKTERDLPMAADLFGELQLTEPSQKRSVAAYIPGLLFVGVASLAALWLSDQYGVPAILMGLLIGLALNFVNADKRLAPGLDFSSQTLLRCGIVLIGLRITLGEITGLGLTPFIALVGIMVFVVLAGLVAARLFKQDILFGLLAGGATAICGASAALAIWGLIGTRRIDQSQFTIVLLGITLASAFAMTFYPPMAVFMGLSDAQAGFLIGASIHDVAQAIGGGFSVSNEAGEVATVVKLSRVTLLAPVLVIVALALRKFGQDSGDGSLQKLGIRNAVPWFIVGFLILVVLNTYAPIPETISNAGDTVARTCLLMAVVAAALKSNMGGLLSHGWRCFGPILATTLIAFLLALGASVSLLG